MAPRVRRNFYLIIRLNIIRLDFTLPPQLPNFSYAFQIIDWSTQLVTSKLVYQIKTGIIQQTSEKLLNLYRTGGPATTWKIQVLLVLQNFYRT